MSGSAAVFPDDVFLALSQPGTKAVYLEALTVPRPKVSARLGVPDQVDAGFSRIIGADLPLGEYDVDLVQSKGKRLEICELHKKFVVDRSSRGAKKSRAGGLPDRSGLAFWRLRFDTQSAQAG